MAERLCDFGLVRTLYVLGRGGRPAVLRPAARFAALDDVQHNVRMPKKAEYKPADTPFAGRVNQLCKRLQMTRTELANLLGVSESALFKWLKGSRRPPVDYLARIKSALESLEQGYDGQAAKRFCLQVPESLGAVEDYIRNRKQAVLVTVESAKTPPEPTKAVVQISSAKKKP